ncbi:uncharacterized protein Z518_10017 [Rhinocladiella mackenziei CBS 650.93]|uniref:Tetrapyrrole biosynthesis uroporphyrinogen III synthase domain-containing protein n=1 Tax=Rhinocladiella mackenziei CBS 650.93 TaxID=1442369 RepID=A0A0D2ICG8_9EURO|nr:uncharacterized protein Z518_10017 [Rhinocladiella mackenziei CBS 650.93]KIX00951.1 hypothetical protein Z518_10017 [Rhinocladiella mackenziei CBS 650.93]
MTTTPSKPLTIPVLLLKTRSQPQDAYEEYFSTHSEGPSLVFLPQFVPVLEHRPNVRNLEVLELSLKGGTLRKKYGGMIFTSQRAVEAWADVVKKVERDSDGVGTGVKPAAENITNTEEANKDVPSPLNNLVDDDSAFPLYTVGPATSRALNTLVAQSLSHTSSPFARLRPSVLGEHTANGENLARYILSHYNEMQSQTLCAFSDAPRLPLAPVLGPSQGQRGNSNDARLQKKGLLFLVGEQRRDIIPKTLMDTEGKLEPQQRISVDEVEVYLTDIMESFQDDFRARITSARNDGCRLVVVVVFSPQGCESMLRSLNYLNEANVSTEQARNRWRSTEDESPPSRDKNDRTYVIVTIGPTTRDHLKNKYGFDADVCAAKPSPQGVGDGLREFLSKKGFL